mmetsp:Transcript_23470/g.34120  ORF Transcript_23470/g.34120 Transcript_23470/m.34120 type:complete len:113 (+) Transcript_23470:352-690(+)
MPRNAFVSIQRGMKGYNRAGAAMLSLGRYGDAREMYQEALMLDGGKNAVAKKGAAMCWEEERRVKVREMELVKQRQQQQEEEEQKKEEEKVEGPVENCHFLKVIFFYVFCSQ